nr:glutathione S-transferase T3-like [Ipomoea batatas]
MSKARTVRTASYSIEEDQLLCHVYVDICQDKVTGHYHAGDAFWTRVMNAYHEALPAHVGNTRPLRSIQTRMQTIMTAIAKLRGCIVQVENLNPSGASEQDIKETNRPQLFHHRCTSGEVSPLIIAADQAHGEDPAPGISEVPTLLYINKNSVHIEEEEVLYLGESKP